MNKNNKKLNIQIQDFVDFLKIPRTIKEIQKQFGKELKSYFLAIPKKYRLLRTGDEEKKFIIKSKTSIKREFEYVDVLDENKKVLKNGKVIIFPNKWKKIRIVPIGDLNFGSKLINMDKVKRYLEWITRDEHVFCYFNGNMFAPTNPDKFNKTFKEFEDMFFNPLKNKLLFIVNGPDENRIENSKIGYNPLKLLADSNQIPFFQDQAHVLFKFKDNKKYLKIFSIHGTSNAVKIGSKINAAINPLSFIDSDIIVMSNLKFTDVKRLEIFILKTKKIEIEQRKVYVILLPSFSSYIGSKDAMKGYPPCYDGQVNIYFDINGDYHVYTGNLKKFEEVLY